MKHTVLRLILMILFFFKVAYATENYNHDIRPIPPKVLYFVMPDKNIKKALSKGIRAPEGYQLMLFSDTSSIMDLLEKDADLFRGVSLIWKINTKQMATDGYSFIQDKNGKWYTQEIPSKYISVLKEKR